jgi:hypothetical protein
MIVQESLPRFAIARAAPASVSRNPISVESAYATRGWHCDEIGAHPTVRFSAVTSCRANGRGAVRQRARDRFDMGAETAF